MNQEISDMFVSMQSHDDGLSIEAKVDFVAKEEEQHEKALLRMLGEKLARKYIMMGLRNDCKHSDSKV